MILIHKEKWENINDNIVYEGNQYIEAKVPLEYISVFRRV